MRDSERLLVWGAVALVGDAGVVQNNNIWCSLRIQCASVRRAASICTVIPRLHSDTRAAAQQHILSGPSGDLELLLFSTAAAIISAND